MVTHIYLVRHGQTAANNEKRYQGQLDTPLSELGWQQARRLGEALKKVHLDAAYASDLQRCANTAQAALAGRDIPLTLLPGLREAHMGEWQGLLHTVVKARYPGHTGERRLDVGTVTPPGGESLAQVLSRMRAAMDAIAARHLGQALLVVSHGGPIRAFIASLLGADLRETWRVRVENAAINRVDYGADGPVLLSLGDGTHLAELATSDGVAVL